MKLIEVMAKAGWENERPTEFTAWEDLDSASREQMIKDLRASLRTGAANTDEPAFSFALNAIASEGESNA